MGSSPGQARRRSPQGSTLGVDPVLWQNCALGLRKEELSRKFCAIAAGQGRGSKAHGSRCGSVSPLLPADGPELLAIEAHEQRQGPREARVLRARRLLDAQDRLQVPRAAEPRALSSVWGCGPHGVTEAGGRWLCDIVASDRRHDAPWAQSWHAAEWHSGAKSAVSKQPRIYSNRPKSGTFTNLVELGHY